MVCSTLFFGTDEWQAYTIYPSNDYISILIRDHQRKEKQMISEEFLRGFLMRVKHEVN
jgi:hypothetical protein